MAKEGAMVEASQETLATWQDAMREAAAFDAAYNPSLARAPRCSRVPEPYMQWSSGDCLAGRNSHLCSTRQCREPGQPDEAGSPKGS